MAITLDVEDGTGTVSGANTYISAADTDAYFVDRANAAWAALTPDQKASALIQATQYLDIRYAFIGVPLLDTQPLAWPRQPQQIDYPTGIAVAIYATTNDAIYTWPVLRLLNATCELALRASTGALYTDQATSVITSEKVDTIAVTYADRQRNGGQVRFAIVDAILKPILLGGGYDIPLLRA